MFLHWCNVLFRKLFKSWSPSDDGAFFCSQVQVQRLSSGNTHFHLGEHCWSQPTCLFSPLSEQFSTFLLLRAVRRPSFCSSVLSPHSRCSCQWSSRWHELRSEHYYWPWPLLSPSPSPNLLATPRLSWVTCSPSHRDSGLTSCCTTRPSLSANSRHARDPGNATLWPPGHSLPWCDDSAETETGYLVITGHDVTFVTRDRVFSFFVLCYPWNPASSQRRRRCHLTLLKLIQPY